MFGVYDKILKDKVVSKLKRFKIVKKLIQKINLKTQFAEPWLEIIRNEASFEVEPL